jgi:adenylate cyclase
MALLRPPKVVLRKSRPTASGTMAHWSYALTVVLAIAVIGLVGFMKAQLLPDLSNLVFDRYQRLDQRAWDPESPVRIVDVDDDSLARIGQWPWPRTTIAEIVTRLGGLGAAVVAIDIVFAEPDGLSPEQVIALLPATPSRTLVEQEIKARIPNDAKLAAAIEQTPTVLGAILTQDGHAVDFPTKFGVAAAGDDPIPFLAHFTSAVLPLPILSAAGAGIGALNWLPDRDQIVRRVPLVLALDKKVVPSLSIEALRVAQGASTVIVRSSNASGQAAYGAHTGVNTIKVGDLEIPTDPQGELRVRYTRSEPRRFIPAWKLLAGEVDRGEVERRIIVIGTSAAGLRDQRATPVDISVAGSEIHAQVIEQVIGGAWLTRPDWAAGAELILAVVLALAFGMILPRISALFGAIGAAAVIALVTWSSWKIFTTDGLLLDPVLPSLSVATAYVACVVWLYRAEQQQRKFVRETFGRYVSPEVLERLEEDPVRRALGGESRIVTIMFCDVRGFTSISERHDAQSLTQFMNEYLTPMTDVVLDHGGFLDKYIGDTVMAFWNAPLDDPDHAGHAAGAALAMRNELVALNQRWASRADARGEPHQQVRFGIGLATGECSVGNFGSVHRQAYSVLGDHVNLASRLEGATKFYQTDILASETTRDLAPDLAWLEVDNVRVVGKTQATRIFTLPGDDIDPKSADFAALADRHGRLLAAYRSGDFVAAGALAKLARETGPQRLRRLYDFYEQRCLDLERARPDDWSPITDLKEK